MPRTVPASISAKTGSGALFFVWLVELLPVGGSALYLSSGKSVTYSGNVYEHDRVKSVDGLTAPYIDYKNLTFGSASIVLKGISDDGSTTLPYVTLEGTLDLEGARVFIHLYDVDAGDAVDAIFQGYVKTRAYDGAEHTATLEASHLWDCPGIVIPSSTLQQEGFGTLDTNEVKESVIDETTLPLFWSATSVKIRPTIYHTRVRASVIQINGVISGCGDPFDPADILSMTLFDSTPADSITFEHRGLAVDVVPDDQTKYPDGLAHNNVAYFSATFKINDNNKGQLDDISADDVRVKMAKGRPLIGTGLPSSNGVLIIKDGLKDPRFGVGMGNAEFADLTAASALAGTLWQVRVELHEQQPVGDWVQSMLTQIHGFCTFNGRKLQLGIKNPAEAPVATYATRRSGHGGLEICADAVTANFESADTLINQVNVKYRAANRHPRPMIAYDSNSQNRLGGTIRTVNPTDFEYYALYDPTQVGISAAMWLREEQNENLRISFEVPLVEGLLPAPGDLITVWSEDVPNNAANSVFRVLAQTFTTGEIPKVGFECRVYKASAHANTTTGIGIDLIRSGVDVSNQGRPPDVTPVSVVLLNETANDTEGVLGHFQATFTYPVVDLATEQADGIFRQYPIRSVRLYCRFSDQDASEYQLVKEVEWPKPKGKFQFDFIKSKSIVVAFVAIGVDRSQGPLGYVPDATKITALTADLTATAALALVGDSGPFTVGDWVLTEFEIDKLLSKAAGQLTFENVAGVRTAQLDTTAIAHPRKTQLAVAKLNYPTLTLSLNVPRFTYPAVTALTLRQRKEAVKVTITDVSADNVEDYFTYWTTNASYSSDVTKLGSVAPAWYTTDPLSPPSGINVVTGKALHFELPQEMIGGNGVIIYARVAARNGKHNWSAQLSPLASNAAGDDAVPVASTPKVTVKKRGMRVKVVVPSLNWKTGKKIEVVIEARDVGSAVLGYLSDATGAGDWESSASEFRFDQQLQPAHLYLSKSDCLALWPTAATLKIRCYLTNDVGTSVVSADRTVTVSSWELEGSITPGALEFPGALVANTVDGDPDKRLARVVVPVGTSNGLSFDSNNISGFMFTIWERNEADTASVGSPQYHQGSIHTGDGSGSAVFSELYLRIGGRFNIQAITALNGDKRTSNSSGSLSFIAGAVRAVNTGDTKVVPAPTIGTITREDGSNKIDIVPVTLTQDGVDIVLCKRFEAEVAINGGAWNPDKGNSFGLVAEDALYTSVTAAKTWDLRIKRKAGATAQYRFTVYAVGGKASATTTSSLQGATAGDVADDSAAASAVQNLALVWTSNKGYKATWQRPASNIKSLKGYWIVYGGPSNWMNAKTGGIASPNTQAGAEFFVTDLSNATHLKRSELDAGFISGGIIVLVTPVNMVAGVETRGSQVFISPYVTPDDRDPIQEDSAAASAVQSLGLVWSLKKGYKATWNRPASNIRSLKGYWIVYGGVSHWMNAKTGGIASPDTQAGAEFFVTDLSNATNLKRSDLDASFISGGITVLVTPVNVVAGVETRGTQVVFSPNVTPDDPDPIQEDSAAASAVQGLALAWGSKKGYRATWVPPASNKKSLKGYKVVYFDNAATSFMVADTGQLASPNTELQATVFVVDTAHITVLKYAQLGAAFTAGVKVKVTPVNIVAGVETDGTATTSGLVAPSNDDAIQVDTAVPSALGTPGVMFVPKSGVRIEKMAVGAAWNDRVNKYVVLYESGGPTYFDLPNYFSSGGSTIQSATEANARYKFGQGKETLSLEVRLADLKTVLGGSATLKAYFYAENKIGTSSKSADSTGVALATAKDVANSKDVIVRVSAGIYPPGKQILANAAMVLDDGAGNLGPATASLRWKRWDKSTLPIRTGAGTAAISTTSTDPIYWSKANRCVVFNDATKMLCQNLQARLMPGERYSISTIKVKSSGTPTGIELRIYFKRNDTAVDNLDNVDNGALAYGKLSLTGLNTAYQEFGIPLKFKDSPSIDDGAGNYVNQMLCIELAGTLGGATVSLTDIMFCRGTIPVAFDVLEAEVGLIAASLLPALVPSSFELSNPVGLDGGWQQNPGLGGVVNRLAQ